jgi:SAM-dependent methyltransferase
MMGRIKREAERWLASGDGALVAPYIPPMRSDQTSSRREVANRLRTSGRQRWRVLDLGCGNGSSHEHLAAAAPLASWVGLDIADSPEVRARSRDDLAFVTFDGVRIPLATGAFDLVYSHQVFEHVRHPQALLGEVARVLAADGMFVGSTSQLEPFHSRSYWNYTAYGFAELLKSAGLRDIEILPGIDGLTLTARRLFSFVKLAGPFDFFFEHASPLNLALELAGRVFGLERRTRALLKLVFAGQFVFVARK